MQLSPTEEAADFLQLHGDLQRFAAVELKLIDADTSLEDFMDLPLVEKLPARDRIYKGQTIDRYAKANAAQLTPVQRTDLEGFKQAIQDRFYIVKLYKKYAVFMTDDALYGVYGISHSLEGMVPHLPAMVEAVLLPFRGKYVYDGYLLGSNIYFGAGYRRSINETFKRIKAVSGIIESPADRAAATPTDAREADARELEHLMGARKRMDEYWYRIEELLENDPSLQPVYDAALSKLEARAIKSRLKKLGVRKRHFAVYHDLVVGVAPNRKALDAQLKTLAFDGDLASCAFFSL